MYLCLPFVGSGSLYVGIIRVNHPRTYFASDFARCKIVVTSRGKPATLSRASRGIEDGLNSLLPFYKGHAAIPK